MSAALSPEARERLMGAVAACYNVNGEWLASHVLVADLRALLADSDALAVVTASRDAMGASWQRAADERDAIRAQVATLRDALECAQYELRLWVQEHGERGPTRFVMGSIADALRATAPEREGADG